MKMNKTTNPIHTILALIGVAAWIGSGIQAGRAEVIITTTPVQVSGTNGICPGGYIGKAEYTKTVSQGWGWPPTGTVHTATDTNRSDTKVEFLGKSSDTGCNQTTVTVPHPPTSTKYRFNVYFTNNVPTNAYPLVLEGFNP